MIQVNFLTDFNANLFSFEGAKLKNFADYFAISRRTMLQGLLQLGLFSNVYRRGRSANSVERASNRAELPIWGDLMSLNSIESFTVIVLNIPK